MSSVLVPVTLLRRGLAVPAVGAAGALRMAARLRSGLAGTAALAVAAPGRPRPVDAEPAAGLAAVADFVRLLGRAGGPLRLALPLRPAGFFMISGCPLALRAYCR